MDTELTLEDHKTMLDMCKNEEISSKLEYINTAIERRFEYCEWTTSYYQCWSDE